MVFCNGDVVEIFENRYSFLPTTPRNRNLGIIVDILQDHNYHIPKALVLVKTGNIVKVDTSKLARI